jgi:hypothetical protein
VEIVHYSNGSDESNQKRSLFSQFKIKESFLAFALLGPSAFAMLLPSFLKLDQFKRRGSTIAIIAIGLAALALLFLLSDTLNFWSRFLFCFAIATFLIGSDCRREKFNDHVIAHFVNYLYVAFFFQFFLMNLNPEGFKGVIPFNGWLRIFSSSPVAADLLLLCFVFQNFGYYLIWELIPSVSSIKRWSSSAANLVNIKFVSTKNHQLLLVLILMSLGLIYRLWKVATGSAAYLDTGGVPEAINGFLSQFERLYVVGWLYAYSACLRKEGSKQLNLLIWAFTVAELFFQIISGSKGRFFNFVILPLATTFLLVRRRVGWLIFSLICTLGLFSWLFVYPVLVIYRESLQFAASLGRAGASISLIEALNIFLGYSWEQYIEQLLTPFNKSGVAEQVAALTSLVHYQVSQPAALLWQRLFLFWVPRFIWADKPQPISGNELGKLSARVNVDDDDTSVLQTSPGEVFAYHGIAGSVLFILSGLLLRWFSEATSPFKILTPFRVAVFVAYLPLIKDCLSGTFESALTGFSLQVGVLYAVLWLAKRLIK